MPESITVTLSEALTKGVTYGVTVEPFDALGKQGAPLMTVFSA
jgi:hypothetical protein